MKKRIMLLLLTGLTACSPVKVPETNQYILEPYGYSSPKVTAHKNSNASLLISVPEALAGYQTEQMHYIQKPFELGVFRHNSWVSSPANMLYPLIVQRMQNTGYFHAVVAGPFVDKADYRLDTQLMALQQNFLVKPSVIELTVNVMLTHIDDNRVVASTIIKERVPCPTDTPYGGVLAANKAAQAFTKKLSSFVISHVQQDKRNIP